MKRVELKNVLKILGTILRCPICSFVYNLETMKVVENALDEESGEFHLVIHSDCRNCKGSVIFSLGALGDEMFSAANLTDLTFEDARRFKQTLPLSSDDCLNIHKELKNLDGAFLKALVTPQAK